MTDGLANGSLLTTTKNLEGITLVQVDGCAAPDFRVTTITTTEHIQCMSQRIHTLFVKKNTGITLGDLIAVRTVELCFALLLYYLIEDSILSFAVHK